MKVKITGDEIAFRIVDDAPVARIELGVELEQGLARTPAQPAGNRAAGRGDGNVSAGMTERQVAATRKEVEDRAAKVVVEVSAAQDRDGNDVDEVGDRPLAGHDHARDGED